MKGLQNLTVMTQRFTESYSDDTSLPETYRNIMKVVDIRTTFIHKPATQNCIKQKQQMKIVIINSETIFK